MQHHARPAGAKYDIHGARRGVDGGEVDQGLPKRFIRAVLPVLGGDEVAKTDTTANAIGAAFLPVAFARNNGNIDAGHGPDIADAMPIGAQYIHHLPACRVACRDLANLRVFVAQIGVDLGQQLDLFFEARRANRVLVAVKLLVGALGCGCIGA
jgi:hypothetical protein